MKTTTRLSYICSLATLMTIPLALGSSTEAGAALSLPAAAASQPQASDNKLVYADFEMVKEKRPFSNRGGYVQLISYAERPTLQSRFKGLEGSNPPAPELVRLRQDDPNRAIAFDFEMQALNAWAGVGVEVHGQEDKDGKPVPDDVSAYKFLSMQIYVTGVSWLRVEFVSKGQGMDMSSGYPKMEFKVSPGFNTYRIPLDKLTQPSYAEVKVKPKDLLKKLTAVNLSVYCEQCTTTKGTLVVDNMTFQN
jgi:hypothetical protein